MNENELLRALQGIQFLEGIDSDHLQQIADIAEFCEFDAHEVLFHEGQAAQCVYLVVSGKLSLELSPATANRKQIVTVGPGEMLGWSSLVESPRFAATAIVIEPVRLVRIDGGMLRAICDLDPVFGYDFTQRVMRALARRLRTTWNQLADLYVSHYLPVTASSDE